MSPPKARSRNAPVLLFTLAWVVMVMATPALAVHPQNIPPPEPIRLKSFPTNLERLSEPLFLAPHDVVLSPDGQYLAVADMGNNRVVLLDPQRLTVIATVGADHLSYPHDVTFDKAGRLWVADSGNDRIIAYELAGGKARVVDVLEGLEGPQGIALGAGRIYIAMPKKNQIVAVRDGKIEKITVTALTRPLIRPHDLEVREKDGDVRVIATDPGNHRLIVFDADLNPISQISPQDPPFAEPTYISFDQRGRLYVADTYNNMIRVFDAEGASLGMFARSHVNLSEGIAVDQDRVWVADTQNGRVLLYRLLK